MVDENPPACAEDAGSVPGLEDYTCCRQLKPARPSLDSTPSRALEPQQVRPWAAVTDACVPRACAPGEEPSQREAGATRRKIAPPIAASRESLRAAMKTQHSQSRQINSF